MLESEIQILTIQKPCASNVFSQQPNNILLLDIIPARCMPIAATIAHHCACLHSSLDDCCSSDIPFRNAVGCCWSLMLAVLQLLRHYHYCATMLAVSITSVWPSLPADCCLILFPFSYYAEAVIQLQCRLLMAVSTAWLLLLIFPPTDAASTAAAVTIASG